MWDSSVLPAAPGSEPGWEADRIDLEAYFARIGYHGGREVSLETLRGLHRAHNRSITWEILDGVLDNRLDLTIDHIQRKIVTAGRGGCCLESNILFAAALEQLGFPVVRHIARVRRGNPKIRTRSHVVPIVEVEGELWMADPGFGDESPLEPIRFQDGAHLTVADWVWRLDLDGTEWVLRSMHADGWFDVYAWAMEHHHPIDFHMINHFSYVDPDSVFLNRIVVQRGDEQARYVLRDDTLVTTDPDGTVKTERLSPPKVVEAIRGLFNIRLSDAEGVVVSEHCAAVMARA